jgi:hypothetical protein
MAKDRLGNDPLAGGGPSWITDTRQEEKTPPQKVGKRRKSTGEQRDKWTRASFTLREPYLKKMRVQALRDGKQLKDILDDILTAHYRGKKITVKG